MVNLTGVLSVPLQSRTNHKLCLDPLDLDLARDII